MGWHLGLWHIRSVFLHCAFILILLLFLFQMSAHVAKKDIYYRYYHNLLLFLHSRN